MDGFSRLPPFRQRSFATGGLASPYTDVFSFQFLSISFIWRKRRRTPDDGLARIIRAGHSRSLLGRSSRSSVSRRVYFLSCFRNCRSRRPVADYTGDFRRNSASGCKTITQHTHTHTTPVRNTTVRARAEFTGDKRARRDYTRRRFVRRRLRGTRLKIAGKLRAQWWRRRRRAWSTDSNGREEWWRKGNNRQFLRGRDKTKEKKTRRRENHPANDRNVPFPTHAHARALSFGSGRPTLEQTSVVRTCTPCSVTRTRSVAARVYVSECTSAPPSTRLPKSNRTTQSGGVDRIFSGGGGLV